MVNAQKWLDKKYPQNKRNEIDRLNISNKGLDGILKLEGFDNLKILTCSSNYLTSLDASDCSKLEEIRCNYNRLTDLNLGDCSQLKEFYCNDNYLKNLDFSSLNLEKLVSLNISDNNLSEKDLSVFSHLINLERLWIGSGNEEKVQQGIYNRFYGSLESLKDLSKLESLEISNTDINGDLNCLPDSCEDIYCSVKGRSESGVKKIAEQLSSCLTDEKESKYNLQKWRENYHKESVSIPKRQLVEYQEQVQTLQQENTKLEKRISQLEGQMVKVMKLLGKQKIRNILLIGRTGQGKSTLANVLSDTEEFKEGKYGVSETKDIKSTNFIVNDINYKVIDTVGLGDTKLTEEEVLDKIAEATRCIKGGLNQVLFVTSGKFSKEEIFTYDLLRKTIFDEDITKYTTIIRTRFPSFENKEECEKDIELMIKDNKELAEVIESCNKRIIHVNNLAKEEDFTLEARVSSRKILLNHLTTCQDIYEPQNLEKLNVKITYYIKKKNEIQSEIDSLKKQLKEESNKKKDKDKLKSQIKEYKSEIDLLSEKIRQETAKHMEEKYKKWAEGAELAGMMVGKFTAVVVQYACEIM